MENIHGPCGKHDVFLLDSLYPVFDSVPTSAAAVHWRIEELELERPGACHKLIGSLEHSCEPTNMATENGLLKDIFPVVRKGRFVSRNFEKNS